MWAYNQTPRPDELYHYGVPGMKWGHRRARNKEQSSKKKQLTTEQTAMKRKKIVKAGVAVVGTVLAAYGVYKVTNIIKSKRVEQGRKAVATLANAMRYQKLAGYKSSDAYKEKQYFQNLRRTAKEAAYTNYINFKSNGKHEKQYANAMKKAKQIRNQTDRKNIEKYNNALKRGWEKGRKGIFI